MRTIKKSGAQGDVMFTLVKSLPNGVLKEDTAIVAHSETGHNHVVKAPPGAYAFFRETPMTAYLQCDVPVEIVHERHINTHETIRLPAGTWRVRRQREWTPEGWVMVAD